MLVESTPVECGRSVETARRSALAPACAHHYSRSHSRWFWGMRLHLRAAPDGTARAAILASADQKERDVALRLFEIGLHGGELIVCDKGYAGRDFEACVAERFGARILRPARQDERHRGAALSWIRQRIESIFCTLNDRLGLQRHRARSLHGLRAPIATKLLALAPGVWLNRYSATPREPSLRSPPNTARNQPSSRSGAASGTVSRHAPPPRGRRLDRRLTVKPIPNQTSLRCRPSSFGRGRTELAGSP